MFKPQTTLTCSLIIVFIKMALNEQEDSTSLRSIFDTASRLRAEIEESYDYQSDAYQDKLRAALTSYQKCKDVIDQISLFSSNEGLEDVSSSEIRFAQLALCPR